MVLNYRCMQDFIVEYMLHSNLLTGNDFMNLANTSRCMRAAYCQTECLKRLWKHGNVRNLKTALYVECKLHRLEPRQILEEAPNKRKEYEVVSALRRLISREDMALLSKQCTVSRHLFLHERAVPPLSILGKRNTYYT